MVLVQDVHKYAFHSWWSEIPINPIHNNNTLYEVNRHWSEIPIFALHASIWQQHDRVSVQNPLLAEDSMVIQQQKSKSEAQLEGRTSLFRFILFILYKSCNGKNWVNIVCTKASSIYLVQMFDCNTVWYTPVYGLKILESNRCRQIRRLALISWPSISKSQQFKNSTRIWLPSLEDETNSF